MEDVCHVINNPPSPLAKRKRTKRLRPHSPASTTTTTTTEEEEETARSLILLAQGHFSHDSKNNPAYTCKTCDRVFSSFQALGGHRTSHKKPKLGGGGEKPDFDNQKKPTPLPLALKLGAAPRMHDCSYCGAEFTSGQALGGHMRRHRVAPVHANTDSGLSLDLNFPAPEHEFEFGSGRPDKMVVPTTLVHCHFL